MWFWQQRMKHWQRHSGQLAKGNETNVYFVMTKICLPIFTVESSGKWWSTLHDSKSIKWCEKKRKDGAHYILVYIGWWLPSTEIKRGKYKECGGRQIDN